MSRKEEILEVAFEIFAKRGYYGTTLEEISSSIGIKKPSLYSHFNNKDEIYDLCIDKYIQRNIKYLESIDKAISKSKSGLYNLLINYIFDDYKYVAFYFRMHSSPQLHRVKVEIQDKLNQEIIKTILESFLKSDVNIEVKKIHLRTFLNGWLVRRYFSENKILLVTNIKEFNQDFDTLYNILSNK